MAGVRKAGREAFLGKREETILKAMYVYRFMTAIDVCRLLYSQSSLPHVRRLLSELAGGKDFVENSYLYRLPLQEAVAGNRVRVYTLGSKGRNYCNKELEYPVEWYYRPDKLRSMSAVQLVHNLVLTRVLVAAKEWAGKKPDRKLLEMRTCYEIGSDLPSVEVVKEGKKGYMPAIPDAWLLFEVEEAGEWFTHPVLLEIDRGTGYRNKFRQQVASRLEFVKKCGVYSRLFGREEVMIAYVTTGETASARESRRRAMCLWTREVLRERRRDSWASVFRFCSVEPEKIYEAGLFEKALWYRPDREESPVGLLEG